MENNRTYTILNISDLAKVDFTQVGETSENTIRKSLDETQFVIKYNNTPTFISDGTVSPIQVLNHTEVLELMSTDQWSEPIE
mgnify:CR=1 FL=1|tara:strand:+ start:675 stop:920 length:246 start_codon:yes stop_codon:yes gene_type:complete